MKVLFIHQNMPGQFKHLAPQLAADPRNEVVFITKRKGFELPGIRRIEYQPARFARPSTHHYLRLFENSVLHGQQVVRACVGLRAEGWRPDLVVAHPGWGESLFIKDVFPGVPVLNYCEYYYRADDASQPRDKQTLDGICRMRARDAHLLLALEACDRAWSPTKWQRSRHPRDLQSKIEVIFDGIDTNVVRPDPGASFRLPSGAVLSRKDEVITYISRNLEPYRGFPTFMRALPEILARRPHATVVVVGGDHVSYGSPPGGGKTWRQVMLEEVSFDASRVHFLPRIPYNRYLSLLQISRVHVYLTVPFVLSWSFLEAMSVGCLVVGSDTPPVREVLRPGQNGFFTSLDDPAKVAADVDAALSYQDQRSIRIGARQTVLQGYDLARCLPAQLDLIRRTAALGSWGRGRRPRPAVAAGA